MSNDKAGGDKPGKGADCTDGATSLDQVVQGSLGRKLRESYAEVVNEEVPTKFLALLDQLKKKEPNVGGGS